MLPRNARRFARPSVPPAALVALAAALVAAAPAAARDADDYAARPAPARHARAAAARATAAAAETVDVALREWAVALSPARVPAGRVVFRIRNGGAVPHAFEVEGVGLERQTPTIAHGADGSLAATLAPGRYEVYCPIGRGSHRRLGMHADLQVTVGATRGASRAAAAANRDAAAPAAGDRGASPAAAAHDDDDDAMSMHAGHVMAARADDDADDAGPPPTAVEVTGDGPVIQILPGPFPFADSAAAVIAARPPDQQADLTAKAHMGPYSNNVARISGTLQVTAVDHGASGDTVSGVSEFTTQDGARWRLVMDRVQTRDIPDNPRFGGVIMGLYYHGASGVHTPLVPTIQSSVALWAVAHLYRNDQLVTDDAMVHIMLLSRTRRPGDFALDCWDCSRRPIEEVQLQVTPAPGTPKFDAPGGFLFVNWEKSRSRVLRAG